MEKHLKSRCCQAGRALQGLLAAALFFLAGVVLTPVNSRGLDEESRYIIGLESFPLRAAPQFSAREVGRLEVGEKIRVLERKAGWLRIEAAEGTGWVAESIAGRTPPPVLQMKILQERLEGLERAREDLEREYETLRGTRSTLKEKLSARGGDPVDSGGSARLRWAALGGGLVIFGWLTGYALATLSHRAKTKHGYRLR